MFVAMPETAVALPAVWLLGRWQVAVLEFQAALPAADGYPAQPPMVVVRFLEGPKEGRRQTSLTSSLTRLGH